MNLHEIVSSAINSINPFQSITITPRGGYTVNQYGEREVITGSDFTVMADVQPLNSSDIQFINNYQSSTEYMSFWFSADVNGLTRPLVKSGDIITWNGKKYYVVNMPEGWYEINGWSHCVGALQLNQQEVPDDDS